MLNLRLTRHNAGASRYVMNTSADYTIEIVAFELFLSLLKLQYHPQLLKGASFATAENFFF